MTPTSVRNTLERDVATTREDALLEIYRRQRPGEPPTVDSARSLLDGLYFNEQRYDLARVGRYKVNKKLGIDSETGERVLTGDDIVEALRYLLALAAGDPSKRLDDIDHFGNRRVRTVGELVQNQFRIGMSRMERVVRERMASQDVDDITPQSLINIRPIVAAIKEFFGSSQLSQFMDQANPLAGLTHQASPLGPRPGRPRRPQVRLEPPHQRPHRGARRPQLALLPHVPDRDARGPQHRPHWLARALRARQRVRLHRGPVPSRRERRGHRQDRLDDGR